MSYNKEIGMYEGYIYKIYNDINDKIYIGQTTLTVEERWKQHLSSTKYYQDNMILHKAMRKYGVDKFYISTVEVVCEITKLELLNKLNDLEIFYIDKYASHISDNGYNFSIGGNNKDFFNKKIDQFSLNGELFQTWESVSDVAIFYNISASDISSCCCGRLKTSAGYVWRIHGESFDQYEVASKRVRKVKKYTIDGKLLRVYNSASDAAKDIECTISSIIKVCTGYRKTLKGFVFRYEEDNFNGYDIKEELDEQKKRIKKRVKKYDLNGNLLNEYESIYQVSALNGFTRARIRNNCNGKQKTCGGHVFRYIDDAFDKYIV